MTLDWNIEKVRDWEDIADGGLEATITQAIVHHTMAIDIGDITEDNVAEVAARIELIEKLEGASVTAPTYEQVSALDLRVDDLIDIDGQLHYVDGFEALTGTTWVEVSKYEHHPFKGGTRGESSTLKVPTGETVPLHVGFEKRPITVADVARRVGLTTNVATRPEAGWRDRIVSLWLERRREYAELQLKRAAKQEAGT